MPSEGISPYVGLGIAAHVFGHATAQISVLQILECMDVLENFKHQQTLENDSCIQNTRVIKVKGRDEIFLLVNLSKLKLKKAGKFVVYC